METLKKIWEFLDGKKVTIAWFFGVLPTAPFIPAAWHEPLMWVSLLIGGGGAIHKYKKGELTKKKMDG